MYLFIYLVSAVPMDGGAWKAAVHGVAKSRARQSDFTFTFHFHALERNGNPFQCPCLENPRDGGAWWAAVYGVAQSRTRLKRLSSSSSSAGSSLARRLFFSGRERGLLSSCDVSASLCGGFSSCGSEALENRPSSCGARA